MADIISFKPTEPEPDRIWTCADCGCQTFRLYADGSTECSLCNRRGADNGGGWLEHMVKDPDFDPDKPTRENVDHGSAHFAQESIKRRIDEHTAALVVIQNDGRIKMWSLVGENDNLARQAWLRKTLSASIGLALGEPVEQVDDNGELPPE